MPTRKSRISTLRQVGPVSHGRRMKLSFAEEEEEEEEEDVVFMVVGVVAVAEVVVVEVVVEVVVAAKVDGGRGRGVDDDSDDRKRGNDLRESRLENIENVEEDSAVVNSSVLCRKRRRDGWTVSEGDDASSASCCSCCRCCIGNEEED